jgi:hypothetical protein
MMFMALFKESDSRFPPLGGCTENKMPPTSLEDALRYFQTTAQNLNKATSKLDDALRAVNDFLVKLSADEVVVHLDTSKELVYERRTGPDSGSEVDGFGIARFTYRGDDEKAPTTEELALALRCLSVETCEYPNPGGEELIQMWRWLPLVQLSGFGAPPLAPRRLRLWAGQNLARIVQEIAEAVHKEAEHVAIATNTAINVKHKLTNSTE